MREYFTKQDLIDYLQTRVDDFKKSEERYGSDDRTTISKFDNMIACKEMVEALIQAPVNIFKSGKVFIGL